MKCKNVHPSPCVTGSRKIQVTWRWVLSCWFGCYTVRMYRLAIYTATRAKEESPTFSLDAKFNCIFSFISTSQPLSSLLRYLNLSLRCHSINLFVRLFSLIASPLLTRGCTSGVRCSQSLLTRLSTLRSEFRSGERLGVLSTSAHYSTMCACIT